MRVIVVGATGTIGSAVVAALATRHQVVSAGHRGGTFQVDLASPDSISQLFRDLGSFDALVSTSGLAKFASRDELTDADLQIGLSNKLMGQVNLVRIGRQSINDRGSFTRTSGVLSQEPMKGSASIRMVHAGLEGFVRASALEPPRGSRLNGVSPPPVTETLRRLRMDPSLGMTASNVAHAYLTSVEGTMTGQPIDPRQVATNHSGSVSGLGWRYGFSSSDNPTEAWRCSSHTRSRARAQPICPIGSSTWAATAGAERLVPHGHHQPRGVPEPSPACCQLRPWSARDPAVTGPWLLVPVRLHAARVRVPPDATRPRDTLPSIDC